MDYWTEADKQGILEDLELIVSGVPAYWKTALEAGAEGINTALCTAGANKSAFLFYSDAHWNYGSRMAPTLLKYLYQHTGITKTFFGGDIVNNEGKDYDTMEYLWDWRRQLKDLPNHHSVVGNHDDGNATNNLFPESYIYGYLLAPEETPDIVREEKGLWYYMDSPAEKTRYLFLDTAYQGATEKQLAFVKAALLSTPESWHIVAAAHIWYDLSYTETLPMPISGINAGAQTILSLFDAYNSRTGDYAECGGWVEFCIGGHCHQDYDGTTATGIPIILVETDSQHVRSTLSYAAGTTTEASVNGIVADYDNHTIHIIRVGRGSSREVNISTHTGTTKPTYTNRIPLAVDTDGATIYNGVGYKANARLSYSGSFKDNPGSYVTGYIQIPTSGALVIRFKNIQFSANNANYDGILTFHKAVGVTYTDNVIIGSADFTNYYSPVYDSEGNLIQISIDNAKGWTHMTVGAKFIDSTSVITVNEEIT